MNAVDLKQRQTIDLGNGVSMVFCFIPKGEFRMGSRYGRDNEQPVHRVIIPEGFWLAQTPVTQEQYGCLDRDHQSYFHGKGKEEHPVEKVDWHQARKFCAWLAARRGQSPWPDELDGLQPDLPTEAQWEYACRAGTDTEYHTGDGEQALMRAGWYGEDPFSGSTHPVRQKAQNAFGLFDMHGNVWEWCSGVLSDTAYRHRSERFDGYTTVQGSGDDEDYGGRVIRGGPWLDLDLPGVCRSAYRFGDSPRLEDRNKGFRVGLFPRSVVPGAGGQVKPEASARTARRRAGAAEGGGR